MTSLVGEAVRGMAVTVRAAEGHVVSQISGVTDVKFLPSRAPGWASEDPKPCLSYRIQDGGPHFLHVCRPGQTFVIGPMGPDGLPQ